MNSKVYIYGLTGDDNVVRYVGKTIRPNIRKLEHIAESKSSKVNYYKNNWIKKILQNGENLRIVILEECDEFNWAEKEKQWIKSFPNLTNISEGGEGSSWKKYTISLNEVKNWFRTNIPQINSEIKWRNYLKYNEIPNFIPRRPDYIFKNKGWISFTDFFGSERCFLGYAELKKIVQKNKLKSIKEYRKFRRGNMPYNPDSFYKNEWVSWGEFLNHKRDVVSDINKVPRQKNILSYTKTQNLIKNENFTKKIEYVNWYHNNRHLLIPANPIQYYKNEWISWNDFFGNNLPRNIDYSNRKSINKVLPYLEAKKWVNENFPGIHSEKPDWRKITKILPTYIPKRPDWVYKNNGWEGYGRFLN